MYSFIIALGPRLGGKTLNFAILAMCEAIANDECELANFGAVEAQAMRCYGYIKKFFDKDPELSAQVKGKITLSKTELKNNSWMQVLVATLAGVNSPHPQKLKADEIELIPWPILQEAWNMPQSTDDIKATTVLGSTRKFAHGPMQRLLDDNMAEVFTFCIWEVMEKWPVDPIEQQAIMDAFKRKYPESDILPEDKTKFNGFFKWRDLLDRIRTLDEETFRAQILCEKPESGGLVYPKFDEILNDNPNFILDKTGGKSLQIWEDFGYARPEHPDAIGFVQVDMQRMEFTVFDELYLYEMGTQDIIVEILQKLQKWDLVPARLKDVSRDQLLGWTPDGSPSVNYAEFFEYISLWVPDYHGLTEIADRQKYGCPIPSQFKITHSYLHPQCQNPKDCPIKDISKMYLKENGIPHVRNFIDDRQAKWVMENTPMMRNDFLSYSKPRKPDGTWGDVPEKRNDHAPDLTHYGTVYNWPTLAYQSFSRDESITEGVSTNVGGEEMTIDETFTSDIMDKVF